METTDGRRGKSPRRQRAESPMRAVDSAPSQTRVTVLMPTELKRKICALCELNGITLSELLRRHVEEKVRNHVISVRSGGAEFFPGSAPIKLAEPDEDPARRDAV